MEVVTCPAVLTTQHRRTKVVIFVAGGISNCTNWQDDIIELLRAGDSDDLVLVNPRRDDFDITNPDMSAQQITWEHAHLEAADEILFWFPKETLCPITLFELGKYCRDDEKMIYVGCHPEYARKFDVEHQLKMVDRQRPVVTSLEELAAQVLAG